MKKPAEISHKFGKYLPYLIMLITLLVFSNSINNAFINLDDPQYVTKNEQIKDLSFEGIGEIFSSYTYGHYQPLSVLTYAIDYALYGLNASGFRVTNIILHLINVLLVFVLIKRLVGRLDVAAIITLLFAVHPLRVESVVWISERKDVLYSVFFFGSMWFYLNYLDGEKQRKNYLLSILLFLLSLFAKSMAVTLPVVLLLLDWYKNRKWSAKVITEKIPFLILSVIFGIVVIQSQKSSDLLETSLASFSIFDRFLLSSFSAVIYVYKTVVPFNTLFMSDYPDLVNGRLPYIYYLAPVVIALIIIWVYKAKTFKRELIFGFLFYLITISLVLQVIPVSGYLWDHYTYIPSIGILFIIGRFYQYVAERKFSYSMKIKTPLTVILILFGIMLIVVTWTRNNTWQNSGRLYTEVIRLHPGNEAAYNNRGQYHMKQENYRKAEQDFTRAIETRSSYATAYLNRGKARFEMKKYKAALSDLNKAITLNPSEMAYMERGILKARLGYHKRAIEDFMLVLEKNPQSSQAFNNMGLSYGQLEKYNKALEAFNRAISINPNDAKAYGNRGTVYFKTGNQQKACSDWSRSARLGNMRARQIYQQYCN